METLPHFTKDEKPTALRSLMKLAMHLCFAVVAVIEFFEAVTNWALEGDDPGFVRAAKHMIAFGFAGICLLMLYGVLRPFMA
jgi:hypothetical protein